MDLKNPSVIYVEPTPAPEPDTNNEEETDMENNHNHFSPWWIVVIVVAIIAICVGYSYLDEKNDKIADQEQAITEQNERLAALEAQTSENTTDPIYVYVPADMTTSYDSSTYSGTADTSGKVTEQSYVPHPRYYQETGTEGTKTFKNIVVNDDEYLIVGGMSVNGTDNGVYRGYGPGVYTIKVTNGFVSIVDDDWGTEEFDFRVDQAVEYGWAHAHIDRGPISE